MKKWILPLYAVLVLGAFFFGVISSTHAYVKVREDGGSQLTQLTQQIEQTEKQNLDTNRQRKETLMKIDRIMIKKRKTARKLINLNGITAHGKKLYDADGSDMDFKNAESDELEDQNGNEDEEEYKDYVMRTIDFIKDAEEKEGEDNELAILDAESNDDTQVVNGRGKIKIPTWDPPVWMVVEDQSSSSWSQFRRKNKILRVSSKESSIWKKAKYPSEVEDVIYDMAREILPSKLMKGFNAQTVIQKFFKRFKIVEVADGILYRPTVYQDRAFTQYANLGDSDEERLLFWSDPMVVNGYHPITGTALNRTILYGAKPVDMDNLVSRGYSDMIDKWNRLQPSDQRVKNPFKGYASRVMPGLLKMSEQGRLTPLKAPSDQQLKEAVKITRNLKILPSQTMRLKKASFKFIYPPKIQLVEDDREEHGAGTKEILLPKLQRETFKNRMEMIKRRLKEIAKLKRENRLARKYVDEIIQSDIQLDQEAKSLIQQMVGDLESVIPQVEMLRKDIAASMEYYRDQLGDLEYEHDTLLQKEWVVLEHAIATKKEYVYILMDSASLRYKIDVMKGLEGGGDDG